MPEFHIFAGGSISSIRSRLNHYLMRIARRRKDGQRTIEQCFEKKRKRGKERREGARTAGSDGGSSSGETSSREGKRKRQRGHRQGEVYPEAHRHSGRRVAGRRRRQRRSVAEARGGGGGGYDSDDSATWFSKSDGETTDSDGERARRRRRRYDMIKADPRRGGWEAEPSELDNSLRVAGYKGQGTAGSDGLDVDDEGSARGLVDSESEPGERGGHRGAQGGHASRAPDAEGTPRGGTLVGKKRGASELRDPAVREPD